VYRPAPSPPAELLRLAIPLRPRFEVPGVAALQAPALHHAHGALFALLGRAAEAVADALHAPSGLRHQPRQPFTAAGLFEAPDGELVTEVQSGATVWLRLTFLCAPMTGLWYEELVPALPPLLHLGPGDPNHSLRVDCPWDYVPAADVPWVKVSAAYRRLWPTSSVTPPDWWRVRFLSPCTFAPGIFNQDDRALAPRSRTLPLPQPDLLLPNLAGSWRAWAPSELIDRVPDPDPRANGDTVYARLARHLQIEEYALSGMVVEAKQGQRRSGFVGTLTLRDQPAAAEPGETTIERRRLFAALFALAPFSGIGVQRARGMGAVSVVPPEETGAQPDAEVEDG
jgi:hypothetical protein